MKQGILESWWDGEIVAPGRSPTEVIANLRNAGFDGVQPGGRWPGTERAHFADCGGGETP